MNNETYNGWANYATWRIRLELIDNELLEDHCNEFKKEKGKNIDAHELAEYIEDWVFELYYQYEAEHNNIFMSYAHSFLMHVNWHDIAENFLLDYNPEE